MTMMESVSAGRESRRGAALLALLLLVPVATLGETAALWWWPGTAAGQGAYFFGKVWLAAFPVVWWRWVDRGAWSWSPARRGGFGAAVVLGLLMAGVIVGAYAITRHNGWIRPEAMRPLIAKNHLDVWWVYLGFVLYVSTVNSLMEEYVWRWFVFKKCEAWLPGWGAALGAALLFTVHHSSALGAYFDWRVNLLGSAGVFAGGAVWSLMYARYRSVWVPYVCHVFADAAIFGIGAHLIFFA